MGKEAKGEMKFRRIEGYLVLGMYLVVGLILGYSIGKDKPQWSLIKKPDTVTVDIVKEGDEILIYLSRCSEGALRDEHYSEELVFEYNKNKEADKTAYRFTLNPTWFRGSLRRCGGYATICLMFFCFFLFKFLSTFRTFYFIVKE